MTIELKKMLFITLIYKLGRIASPNTVIFPASVNGRSIPNILNVLSSSDSADNRCLQFGRFAKGDYSVSMALIRNLYRIIN
jgi:hypothetical protein